MALPEIKNNLCFKITQTCVEQCSKLGRWAAQHPRKAGGLAAAAAIGYAYPPVGLLVAMGAGFWGAKEIRALKLPAAEKTSPEDQVAKAREILAELKESSGKGNFVEKALTIINAMNNCGVEDQSGSILQGALLNLIQTEVKTGKDAQTLIDGTITLPSKTRWVVYQTGMMGGSNEEVKAVFKERLLNLSKNL